ncbi:MAG: alpha/beta fold hydrolase [Lachnospiraceae bacterium]|nr:alpha/beta fold hydrolase [Lachnospiraceae bacterium]
MRKGLKIFLIIPAVVLTAFLLLAVGGSWYIGEQVFEASTQLVTPEETRTVSDSFWKKMNMDPDAFRAEYVVESISETSTFDGHVIPGEYINAGGEHDKAVILIHGLGGNRYSNYPLAKYFVERGFDVITYDQRSSNENTAERTTYGYWEKHDVIDLMDYAQKKHPGIKLGLWGTSFGGATAVQAVAALEDQSRVSFMILDCPLGNVEYMISSELDRMDLGIPTEYMLWLGNIFNKQKLGFSYEDADSIRIAKEVTVPALVINSRVDEMTPYFMGKEIYDNMKADKKEIWTVDDSEHACIWEDHGEEYRSRMDEFLSSVAD